MTVYLPYSGSVWSSITAGTNGCIPGSENKPTWFGIRSALGGAGSAAFFAGASTSGCQIDSLTSACGIPVMHGPFINACGIHFSAPVSACVIGWIGDRAVRPARNTK